MGWQLQLPPRNISRLAAACVLFCRVQWHFPMMFVRTKCWFVQSAGVCEVMICTKCWCAQIARVRVRSDGVYKVLECTKWWCVRSAGVYQVMVCTKCWSVYEVILCTKCWSEWFNSISFIKKGTLQRTSKYSYSYYMIMTDLYLPSGSRQGRLPLDPFNINYTVIWKSFHITK